MSWLLATPVGVINQPTTTLRDWEEPQERPDQTSHSIRRTTRWTVQHEGRLRGLRRGSVHTKTADAWYQEQLKQGKADRRQHSITACIQLAEEECWNRIHPTVVQAVWAALTAQSNEGILPTGGSPHRPTTRHKGVTIVLPKTQTHRTGSAHQFPCFIIRVVV